MELTPRIRQILSYMLSTSDTVTDREIAEALGVSKRTILREVDYISTILEEYDIRLIRKKGEGSRIEGDNAALERLKSDLGERERIIVSDKEKRQNLLKFELLRSIEPQKLFYYSDLFGVSEATISNDLEALNEWAEEYHLSIIKKPGYGIMLSGSEKDYRAAMQRVVSETMKDEQLKSLGDNIYQLMNEEILSGVTETLDEIDEPYLEMLTNDAYLGLLIHLAVAVERIRQGEYVEAEDTYDATLEEGYEIAKHIAGALEDAFDLQIPEVEVNNILLHIKGAKLHYSNARDIGSGIRGDELIGIVDAMIDTFDPEFASELKYEDDFIQGLLVHLEPALYRMKNDMTIYNPLLDEIKNEYPDMFESCEKAAKVITERTGIVPGEAEIGYLVMHFGAAREKIESRKKKKRIVNAGVICASGFGVARLMLAKLKSKFSDKEVVFHAFGSDEISQHVTSKIDFFISSINVDTLHVDYVMVSPLITQKDIVQISVKIGEYALMPAKQENSDFTRQLDEINVVISRVKGIIRRYHHILFSSGLTFEGLISELAEDVTESGKAQAVLWSDLMAREKVMSQLFPELGVALMHCKSKAVTECRVVTGSLEGDEGFRDPKLAGIDAVLCMIIPNDDDRKINAEMLGRISGALVEDEDFLGLIKAGEEDGIREKLQEILKSYFGELINAI